MEVAPKNGALIISILFSITSFFRPAIHKSMAARQAQLDDLIRKQAQLGLVVCKFLCK